MKFLEEEFEGAYSVIVEQLKEFASRKGNELFKDKLESSTQTADQLESYITGEAKKQATNNVAVISDAEVVGWAIHFIDENIQETKPTMNCNVTKLEPAKPKEVVKPKKEVKSKEVKKEAEQKQISIFDLL